MIVLMTTPRGVHSFDTVAGRITRLALGKHEYGGLSWDEENIYLTHSNIDNASLVSERDYRNADVGVVRAYSATGVSQVAIGLSQPHQILVDSMGRLLIANTGLNRIDVVKLNGGRSESVYLNNITCDMIDDEKGGDHFNGFYEHENSLFIVAHNNGRKSKLWQLDKESFALQRVYDTEAEWAHNCWVCEHGIVICNSRSASLYEVQTGETLWKADAEVITRGLAATDEYIFVGHSEFGDRLSRRYSAGGFWVIDRKTLQTLDKYIFPGTGCTQELRLADEFDYCHKAPILRPDFLELIYDRAFTDMVADKYKALSYRWFGI